MRVNRYNKPPARNKSFPCGCFALIGVTSIIAIIGVIAFVALLPSLALQIAGFAVVGNTEEIFEEQTEISIQTLPQLTDASPVNSVTINSSDGMTITLNQGLTNVNTGVDSSGIPMAQAQLTEPDLQRICQQYTDYCSQSGDVLRNARIDLRVGGAVIYGEVNIPDTSIWQNVGIVVQITTENRLNVRGIDMNGTLYALPADGIGQIVRDVEQQLNQRLQQEQILMGGEVYRIQQISSNNDQITVVLR